MKRYVIVEKESNLAVNFPESVEENNDGTFRDVDEDTIYYKGGYTYYPDVEVPESGGLWRFRYTYTPDEGFKLAYTQKDVIEWQKQASHEIATSQKRRMEIEEKITALSQGTIDEKDKIEVLQEAICDLYEMIIQEG